MKATVSVALTFAALAQAADMAPQQPGGSQVQQQTDGGYGSKYPAPKYSGGGPGSSPENLKRFSKELARFGSCFIQRFWHDAQRINCGKCAPGAGDSHQSSLLSCVCSNHGQLAHQVRRNFDTCTDRNSAFSNLIQEISADVGGRGISALCSAYTGDSSHNHRHHHHHHHESQGYGAETGSGGIEGSEGPETAGPKQQGSHPNPKPY